MPVEVPHYFDPRGAIKDLIRCHDPEVLLHGPAGTGKSYGIGQHLLGIAAAYAGARILVVRKTRVSLTESWLVTWETKILGNGIDERVLDVPLANGPGRAGRHVYTLINGSEIIPCGMDNPTRLFSLEADIVYVQEATELTEAEWESLHRALRNGVVPWQQLIGDCNPDADTHWLNLRMRRGLTKGLRSKHTDNPMLETKDGRAYLERLSHLTGVRRKRLYEGLWVAAEGMIFEDAWSPDFALWVDGKPRGGGNLVPHLPMGADGKPAIKQYVAGVDWGFRAPGCIEVFAVDAEKRMFRVAEVYRVQKTIDWWVEKAKALHDKYGISHFACDPAEPGYIEQFRRAGLPIREHARTENEWAPGIDRMRDFMAQDKHGERRFFVVTDSLEERDKVLDDAKAPCGLLEEIPQYIYAKAQDGRAIKEKPDDATADHACDSARYACMYVDRYISHSDMLVGEKPLFPVGTLGHLLRHEDVYRAVVEDED